MQNRIKSSANELKNTYSLVMCAVLIALFVILDIHATIPIYKSLHLTSSFLVLAIIGHRFGIVMGSIAAIPCDIIPLFFVNRGPFHPGFVVATMLTVATFALFLYKSEIKLWRIIAARVIINFFINSLLHPYLLSQMYTNSFSFYFIQHITKNFILLPIEIFLLFFFLNFFAKVMKKAGNMH